MAVKKSYTAYFLFLSFFWLPLCWAQNVEYYRNQMLSLLGSGNYALVNQLWQKMQTDAAQVKPDLSIFNARMVAHFKLNAFEQCLSVFEELHSASELKPNILTYKVLFDSYYSIGNYSQLVQAYSAMRAVSPEIKLSAKELSFLIVSFFSLGQFEKALEVYQENSETIFDSSIYALLVQACCELKEYQEILNIYQKMFAADPTAHHNLSIFTNQVFAHIGLKNFNFALELYQPLLKVNPVFDLDLKAFNNLLIIYNALGQFDKLLETDKMLQVQISKIFQKSSNSQELILAFALSKNVQRTEDFKSPVFSTSAAHHSITQYAYGFSQEYLYPDTKDKNIFNNTNLGLTVNNYNFRIDFLLRSQKPLEALNIYHQMREKFPKIIPNNKTYILSIIACFLLNKYDEISEIYEEVKVNFNSIQPKIFIFEMVILSYYQSNKLEEMLRVYDEMNHFYPSAKFNVFINELVESVFFSSSFLKLDQESLKNYEKNLTEKAAGILLRLSSDSFSIVSTQK